MTTQKDVDKAEKLQSIKTDETGGQIDKSKEEALVSSRLIYGLTGYYTFCIVLAAVLLTFLIANQNKQETLFRVVGFIASGAVIGSVLYQIRMLFRYYIKDGNFDAKWLGKYISAPWESVALSVVVYSLLQGGGVVLGGSANFSSAGANGLSAFGLGALVGFGMRDVVGWLGNLVKTMFPTEPHK